jgi:hypothetical protein
MPKDIYRGNDNQGKPRLAYALRIWWMTDAELLTETEHKIWLSAFASNNPRSDYHWHVDMCWDEWTRRDKIDKYSEAYDNACKSTG